MGATEDDARGGIETVLAEELARYGLPASAGLTGLLRHIYTNRDMALVNYRFANSLLTRRLTAVQELCRTAQDPNYPNPGSEGFALRIQQVIAAVPTFPEAEDRSAQADDS